jgi:hypothetical protein
MKRLFIAILSLLLTTAPFALWAQTEVAVSQESSPGAGDFNENFLGYVEVFDQSAYTAAAVYQYDTRYDSSYNGSVTPWLADTTQLFIVNTSDGLSLFVVHDKPEDGDGGRAQMRFVLLGDPDGATRLIEDDSGDASLIGNLFGPEIFQTHHHWLECCTDGVVIGALDGPWSMLVSFSDVDDYLGNEFLEISSWLATSADGTTIPLELSVDRRVLLRSFIVVDVDIKPGSESNCFNNDDNGVIRVAILGSETVDVTQIDPYSVSLEGMAIKMVGKAGTDALFSIGDVNDDGHDDLIVRIQDEDGIFEPGEGEAIITGLLEDGRSFQGSDYICVTQ